MKEKILIASDHAGFEIKEELKSFLTGKGYNPLDFGPLAYSPEDDYTDYVSALAKSLSLNPSDSFGIVIGGSGQGEAIMANRFHGVRAIVYYGRNEHATLDSIRLGREHNDANVLSLGARFISVDEAKECVLTFLNTKFSGDERHIRRIKEIEEFSS